MVLYRFGPALHSMEILRKAIALRECKVRVQMISDCICFAQRGYQGLYFIYYYLTKYKQSSNKFFAKFAMGTTV